jgi:hypothetical protein
MNHLDGYLGPEPSKVISSTLKRRSLDAPGGFPMFRVVHSEFVYEQIGGEWSDWDESIPYDDRGKLSNIVDVDGKPMPLTKPLRTVTEIRTIPKYVNLEEQGWILERWFPPHKFGSPEEHYSHVVPGTSVPKLGPYPDRGAYVMLTGPFPEVPSIDFLQDFIGYHQSITEAIMDQDVEAYIKQRVYDREKAAEKKQKEGVQASTDRMMDHAKGILLGTSLAAGRLRSRAAERMGIRSHVGN